MLTDAPVITMLPVIDLKRTHEFDEKKPGLKPAGLRPD